MLITNQENTAKGRTPKDVPSIFSLQDLKDRVSREFL